MSAHETCKRDYILKCVRCLQEYDADRVDGVWKIEPRDKALVGKTIAIALSHPSGVGNAYYRIGYSKRPRWVATAAYRMLET